MPSSAARPRRGQDGQSSQDEHVGPAGAERARREDEPFDGAEHQPARQREPQRAEPAEQRRGHPLQAEQDAVLQPDRRLRGDQQPGEAGQRAGDQERRRAPRARSARRAAPPRARRRLTARITAPAPVSASARSTSTPAARPIASTSSARTGHRHAAAEAERARRAERVRQRVRLLGERQPEQLAHQQPGRQRTPPPSRPRRRGTAGSPPRRPRPTAPRPPPARRPRARRSDPAPSGAAIGIVPITASTATNTAPITTSPCANASTPVRRWTSVKPSAISPYAAPVARPVTSAWTATGPLTLTRPCTGSGSCPSHSGATWMSTVLLGALEVRLGLGALLLVGAQRLVARALDQLLLRVVARATRGPPACRRARRRSARSCRTGPSDS